MKIVAVIPARFNSTRLPGKVIKKIGDKPLIYYPYKEVLKSEIFDSVYIATDDLRVKKVASEFNADVIMTSSKHKTGTDRVAEVANKINADIYVNIQGDEIGIKASSIEKITSELIDNSKIDIANLVCEITNPVEILSSMVVKVSMDINHNIMYFSRSPIPYPKTEDKFKVTRQIGLYAFRKEPLSKFSNIPQTPIEYIEGIEMLRFLENGYKIKAVNSTENNFDIDTYEDLSIARKIYNNKGDLNG